MLAENTNVLMAGSGTKAIQHIYPEQVVKTYVGDKKVISVSNKEELFYKFIFSDGYKCQVSESQLFMTPSLTFIAVRYIKEGDVFRLPGDRIAKVIDITPLDVKQGYNISLEDEVPYTLETGLSSK